MPLIKTKDATEAANKERRERIATAVLAGLVTRQQSYYDYAAADAVTYADALIAELDKSDEEKT